MNNQPAVRSFLDFLKCANNYTNNENNIQVSYVRVLEKFCENRTLPSTYASVPFFLDFRRQKYLFFDKSCRQLLGYKADFFIKGGLESFMSIYHKEDFNLYNKKIFPECIKLLKERPVKQHADLVFSLTHKIKSFNGKTVDLLQRYTFISDPSDGFPLGMVGSLMDFTNFKNDRSSILTMELVEKYNEEASVRLLTKKRYFADEMLMPMSKREMEVLKCMSEGLSSKVIADRLKISLHTVNNHRKNMLHKTNSKNAADLINTAVRLELV